LQAERKLLEDALEGLFHIAKADKVLHPREVEFLGQVAKRFRITETIDTSRRETRLAKIVANADSDGFGRRPFLC